MCSHCKMRSHCKMDPVNEIVAPVRMQVKQYWPVHVHADPPSQGPDMRLPKIVTFCWGDAVARAVIGPLSKTWHRTIKVHNCVKGSMWSSHCVNVRPLSALYGPVKSLRPLQGPDVCLPKMLTLAITAARAVIGPLTTSFPGNMLCTVCKKSKKSNFCLHSRDIFFYLLVICKK